MMNRQIRRAQEKQDRKVDKEREKRREARRDKVQRLREQRARSREAVKKRREAEVAAKASGGAGDGDAADGAAGTESAATRAGGSRTGPKAGRAAASTPSAKGRKPGRFSGVLMMATVFFIVLQSAVPAEEAGPDTLRTITSAGFYLLFGYFSTLWLMRRATPRPIVMTMISGVMLTAGVEVAKRLQPEVTTDLLLLALAIPAIAAGAFLGRLVYTNTPA